MPNKLTKREQEYLEWLLKYPGETQRERARRMGCSYCTAKTHGYRLRRKLGARSTTEAALIYLKDK